MKKVFLGGTCNNSKWRSELIPLLKLDYFNPVVDDWKPEHLEEEIRQRNTCDFVLYVLTSELTGLYSIAELVDDSNKRPDKTIFCFIPLGFDDHQIKSLEAISMLVEKNGAFVCKDLNEVADILNNLNELAKMNANIKYMTEFDIAKELDVSIDMVLKWVDKGFMKSTSASCCMIRTSDVQRFIYVPISIEEASYMLDTIPEKIKAWVREGDLPMVNNRFKRDHIITFSKYN